jgi:hypothetical protein
MLIAALVHVRVLMVRKHVVVDVHVHLDFTK